MGLCISLLYLLIPMKVFLIGEKPKDSRRFSLFSKHFVRIKLISIVSSVMNWPLCIAYDSSSLTSLLMVTLWNVKVLCSGSACFSDGSYQLFSGPFVQRCSDGIRSLLHLITFIGYPSKAIRSFLTLIMIDRTTFRSRAISLSILSHF